MTIAIRRKVTILPNGKIEIQDNDLRPGASAEVIILVDEEPTIEFDQEQLLEDLQKLFKTTQALPNLEQISEDEIAAEIEAYRSK